MSTQALSVPISSLSLLLVQTQVARWKAATPEQLTDVHLYIDTDKFGFFFHAVGNVMYESGKRPMPGIICDWLVWRSRSVCPFKQSVSEIVPFSRQYEPSAWSVIWISLVRPALFRNMNIVIERQMTLAKFYLPFVAGIVLPDQKVVDAI